MTKSPPRTPNRYQRWLNPMLAYFIIILLTLLPLHAQDGAVSRSGKYMPSPPTATNTPSPAAALETLKQQLDIEQTGPDTIRVGRVTLNKRERTVTIPCRVNMHRYVVEYLLVTDIGKRHESVLATDAKAEQIHIASLLLGVSPTNMPGGYKQPCPLPQANAVDIEASWATNGTRALFPLDKLVIIRPESTLTNAPAKATPQTPDKPLSPGKWFYNGSYFGSTKFEAQVEGSIVALIRDPAALINNPRVDLDNDKIHYPNDSLLPPDGTPVDVILQFPK